MIAVRSWPQCRWLHALWLPGLVACQAPQQAPAPTPAHAELVRAELAQLVAAQQPPCGAVLQYTRHGRLDYRVECASGRAYRVRVSADGRVAILAHEPARAASAAP